MPITVNVAGQVGQIRLPTSKALWPLFETVINSIQSLEESDTKKKVIVIDALRPEHTQLKTGEQGRTIIEEQAHFEAFTVTDNGNGFNTSILPRSVFPIESEERLQGNWSFLMVKGV